MDLEMVVVRPSVTPSEQSEREGEAPAGFAGGGGDVSPYKRPPEFNKDKSIEYRRTDQAGHAIRDGGTLGRGEASYPPDYRIQP